MQDNSQKDSHTPEEVPRSEEQSEGKTAPALENFYYLRFRTNQPAVSAVSRIDNLEKGEAVMVQTDHGLEPAVITAAYPQLDFPDKKAERQASHLIVRRANRDEQSKIERMMEREAEAFSICHNYIEKHHLAMKLTRVERLFNGSKIIFYFTAENRVDFRELVKDLVQEFRTRVEIRQIGVRHETKMIGGLGGCGRELCCSSFLKDFAPVSIKMAKEQNLPLNPAKISGVCNRLLCCLTYEYKTYHKLRKGMPRPGKTITMDGVDYKVLQSNILKEEITVMPVDDPDHKQVISRDEWHAITGAEISGDRKKQGAPKKQKGKSRRQKTNNQQDDSTSDNTSPEQSQDD